MTDFDSSSFKVFPLGGWLGVISWECENGIFVKSSCIFIENILWLQINKYITILLITFGT